MSQLLLFVELVLDEEDSGNSRLDEMEIGDCSGDEGVRLENTRGEVSRQVREVDLVWGGLVVMELGENSEDGEVRLGGGSLRVEAWEQVKVVGLV